MKIMCGIVAMAIALLNIAIFELSEIVWLRILLCCIVSSIGVFILYYWLVSPILEMKKKLDDMEKENNQLEAMRKEFVANVTHELKTPLTSISGFVETLQSGAAENPEIRNKFIDIIAIETSRLQRLIEDTLILSEIESKKVIKRDNINIKESIENIISILAPISSAHSISIQCEIEEGLTIDGNEDRFKQMMFNLVENAIKYSNEGGHVWIESYRESGNIILSVRDEGVGISEEDVDRLFERFYRVDKSRSRRVEGTGLGLSIVKHVAVLFDAEVKVESELGVGSTFYVVIEE